MQRTISTAFALLTSAIAKSEWRLENAEFDAINKSSRSKHSLEVKYGPNNQGYFGAYAYIYLEVGGDEIPDGSVVTTWASVTNPDFT